MDDDVAARTAEARSGREICSGCSRPSSACICSSLPDQPLPLPLGLESILLLRHPKERRQKHQSAWILERCISSVRQYVARRLPPLKEAAVDSCIESTASLPAGLDFIYEHPETCLLVFPGVGSRPLHEVWDENVKHLVFIDATWRFAREMASVGAPAQASLDPLSRIRRVELTPPAGLRPVFVVRKPMKLESSPNAVATTKTTSGSEAGETEDDARWGFSTAEAVALAVDEVATLRTTGTESSFRELDDSTRVCQAWNVVSKALGAYARIQLERTVVPRIRVDRPGFIPKLYEGSVVTSGLI